MHLARGMMFLMPAGIVGVTYLLSRTKKVEEEDEERKRKKTKTSSQTQTDPVTDSAESVETRRASFGAIEEEWVELLHPSVFVGTVSDTVRKKRFCRQTRKKFA